MNPQQELDFKILGRDIGRSIEEIIFCTVHPNLTGTHRRETAINTFGDNILALAKHIENLNKIKE